MDLIDSFFEDLPAPSRSRITSDNYHLLVTERLLSIKKEFNRFNRETLQEAIADLCSYYALVNSYSHWKAVLFVKEKCKSEMSSGSVEYTDGSHLLAFGRKLSDTIHMPVEDIYKVLLAKHVFGLQTYINNTSETNRRDTLLGRIADTINYSILLYLATEEKSR